MQGSKSVLSDPRDHVLSQSTALPPRERRGSDAMGSNRTLSVNEQIYLRDRSAGFKGGFRGEEEKGFPTGSTQLGAKSSRKRAGGRGVQ